ncbi:MAG TPA: hypothetical protein VI524_14350 [Anaerolineales bacterium]|nr:hypothetical protein [Anaerolineales bacterium]
MPNLPSGTVTFLFTDIEGSTRLARDASPTYGFTVTWMTAVSTR